MEKIMKVDGNLESKQYTVIEAEKKVKTQDTVKAENTEERESEKVIRILLGEEV